MTRAFWPAAITLLAYLAVVQIFSALRESNIVDEPIELAAGYSYLTTGDFRMNPEHPPLAKMWSALPLLAFHPPLATDQAAWEKSDQVGYGLRFFRLNRPREDAMLFAARLMSILLTAALGLAIAWWTRAAFGPLAALIALTLYAFDPTITAHGRYVKNDLAVTLLAFLACIAWGAFLARPSALRLVLAGLALGLANAVKFSAVFLLPVFAILLVISYWQDRERLPLWRGALALSGAACMAAVVVWTAYGFHVRPYLTGMHLLIGHNKIGHKSYLLGMESMKGWWYYFPVAFAVKTPVATLAFLALAFWAVLRRARWTRVRTAPLAWFVMAIPLAVYGASSVAGNLNIGIRHLLPIWPFVFVLAAAAFTHAQFRYARPILLALAAGLIAESVAIYPHYLAFFNVLAGGPANGPRILGDSNIDWGQDAGNLARWMRDHPAPRFCVDYSGTADLDHLGIRIYPLAWKWDMERRVSLDCIAAISVSFIEGIAPNPRYGWLHSQTPAARIGYSIYVYDLPKLAREGRIPLLAATAAPAFVRAERRNGRGLALFMTGLGPVERIGDSSYAQLPLYCQWNAAQGGPNAEVSFAGLAPGKPGIYAVNVMVPPHPDSAELSCYSALFSGARSAAASIVIPAGTS